MVLAALFLVGTAISRGWIGPELQLLGATLTGLGLLVGGERLRRTNASWSEALAVGGVIVLPSCAAAAHLALDLIGALPALVLVSLIGAALALFAHGLDFESVAAVAIVAMLGNVVALSPADDIGLFGLSAFAVLIAIGATVGGIGRGWTVARQIGVWGSAALLLLTGLQQRFSESLGSAAGIDLSAGDQLVGLVATAVIGLVAWSGPALNTLFSRSAAGRSGGPLLPLDERSVVPVPAWAFAMMSLLVRFESDVDIGIAALIMAAGFVAAATLALPAISRRMFAAMVVGAASLGAAGFAFLTDGPSLLVAIAAQAAGLALLTERFDDWLLRLQAAALGTLATLITTSSILMGWVEPATSGVHLANLFVVVLIAAGALLVAQRGRGNLARPLAALSWVLALGLIASIFVHGPQGQVVVSALWALAAAGAIATGVRFGEALARALGLATLAVVLTKMATVDLAAVETFWRVGLFFLVGLGLLRLGYVLPRLARPRSVDGMADTGPDGHPAR